MSVDAARLHRDSLVVDGHSDSVPAHATSGRSMGGGDTGAAHDGTIRHLRGKHAENRMQLDFASMRDGGIDVAFCAMYVSRDWNNELAVLMDGIGALFREADAFQLETGQEVQVVRTAADIDRCKADGALGALIALEDSDGIQRSLNTLRSLYELGLRSVGITHNPTSWAAAGLHEESSGGGLTQFGVALVEELESLGIITDVAHLPKKGFWDVAEVAQGPIVSTHGNCQALCSHPRNLDDTQLEAVAASGGLVGMTFYPKFLSDSGTASLDDLLRHVDRAIEVMGPEHVGLGSDFDGGGTLLASAADYPTLTETMLSHGLSEEVVRGILGQNFRRVIAQVCG